jgi:hypothetical protein
MYDLGPNLNHATVNVTAYAVSVTVAEFSRAVFKAATRT